MLTAPKRIFVARPGTVPSAVAFLLLIHAALLAYGAAVHSPTMDEVAHLPAGITHWHFGRFDLYCVNPPLVQLLASFPVVCAQPVTDWSRLEDGGRPEWNIGIDFIKANGEKSFWYFTLARWACVPLSLLGGYVCSRWACDLYGRWAGSLALTLWCFSPNILAHGQLITPDMGATALGLSAMYAFWRWLRQSTWPQALVAGIALGLAELTKTTWIILFLLWPPLWLLWKWAKPNRALPRAWLKEAFQLLSIVLLALYLINLTYGFQGSFERLKNYAFFSKTLSGDKYDPSLTPIAVPDNCFSNNWLGALPLPLPRDYVQGIDLQKWDLDRPGISYLHGKWQMGGWWYYYIYALAIKVPLGTWLLLIMAIVLRSWRFSVSAHWYDEVILLTPAVVVIILVSAHTGFNRHMRYILPIFPFVFIWISRVAAAWTGIRCILPRLLGTGALAWSVGSSLYVYPHSLSYFNELVGGPTGGHAHLLVSNIDWGQDLLILRRWLSEHPEARPLGLVYWGPFPPEIAGVDGNAVPEGPNSSGPEPRPGAMECGPQPGWYAISVFRLRAPDRDYSYFLRFKPVAMAGYSIYIYHITLEEANRVRRELGLPSLPAGKQP